MITERGQQDVHELKFVSSNNGICPIAAGGEIYHGFPINYDSHATEEDKLSQSYPSIDNRLLEL